MLCHIDGSIARNGSGIKIFMSMNSELTLRSHLDYRESINLIRELTVLPPHTNSLYRVFKLNQMYYQFWHLLFH